MKWYMVIPKKKIPYKEFWSKCQTSPFISSGFMTCAGSCVPPWLSKGLLSEAKDCTFLLQIINGRRPLGWDKSIGRKCRAESLRRGGKQGRDDAHFWQCQVLFAPVWTELASHGEGRVLLGPLSLSESAAGGRIGVDVCAVIAFSLSPTHFQKYL